MPNSPCVSVVIPCLNEVTHIGACLEALRVQEGVENWIEVLVVDGGSTDGTLGVVESAISGFDGVSLLHNNKRFTPISMNLGLRHAQSDVVVILGGHSQVSKDFVKRNLEALQSHPECGCVGGVVEQVHGDEKTRTIGLAMSSPFGVGDARFRTGGAEGYVDTVAFGAYRKQVLLDLGGLDEALVRNQDDELNYRLTEAGWRIWFDPQVRSTYHARSSFSHLFQQYWQYGYWKVFVNRKHKTVTTWRQLVPAVFVLALFSLGSLSLASQVGSPRSFASAFFWACLAAVCGLWASGAAVAVLMAKVGLGHATGMVRAFATLHVAYGLGYWQGIWHFLLLRRMPSARSKSVTR